MLSTPSEDTSPAILVSLGESFLAMESDAALAFIEAETSKRKEELAALEADLESIDRRMADLKKALYGRFGKAIHLEEDDGPAST